jgi:hypothetical protein
LFLRLLDLVEEDGDDAVVLLLLLDGLGDDHGCVYAELCAVPMAAR